MKLILKYPNAILHIALTPEDAAEIRNYMREAAYAYTGDAMPQRVQELYDMFDQIAEG